MNASFRPILDFDWAAASILPAALVAVLAAGCVIVDDEKQDSGSGGSSGTTWGLSSSGDSGEAGTTATTGDGSGPTVTVEWGAESLSVSVSDGGDWQLGMAETGGSCGGAVDCWTGEDCHLGYTSDGATVGPWCHGVTAGTVSLAYGGDPTSLEAGTTVFAEGFKGTVTYLLLAADGSCWVFGDDTDYYDALGCGELR